MIFIRVHKTIFNEMHALIARHFPIDLVTLTDSLESKGLLEQSGGFAYLAELSKNTPSAANIHAYAMIVREASVKRELCSWLTILSNKLVYRVG